MNSLRTLPRACMRAFSTSTPRPLAKMQLIGRLADQPELTATSTGHNVTRFALGVNAGPKDEAGNRPVSWFRVATFIDGPQRDLLMGLPKGTQMFVEADARMETYQAQDGTNRTSLNLLMRNFEPLARPLSHVNTEGGAEPMSGSASG